MVTVCDARQCTMCNACVQACPKNCIESVKSGNMWYMTIDKSKCISCHICETVCPNCTEPPLKQSETVYAAWAKDTEIRKKSASGGIASTIYAYALSVGMHIAGVELNDTFEAHFKVSSKPEDITHFQNSKYTFSFTDSIYSAIESLLKCGDNVLFIGLPCQAAGLKNYLNFRKTSVQHLYTVDLICHGTPLPEYLQNHICTIETRKGFKADQIYFRDPRYGTGNFLFTIYGKQIISTKDRKFSVIKKQATPAYKKLVISNDLYQIGYHNGWIYRECCYQCHYAKKERTGDLTLGDSHGLGKIAPYHGQEDNVSFVLVNTSKGTELLNKMESFLCKEERPLTEPYTFEPQLSYPSKGGQKREEFKALINEGCSFEEAAEKAFKKIASRNHVKEILHIYWIENRIKRMVPSSIKRAIKKL